MKKKLPIAEPIIKTYNYEAFPMAVLGAHSEQCKEWLLSNYIQMNCHKNILKEKDVFLAFYDNQALKSPYISKQTFFLSSLMHFECDVNKYIECQINNEYYLYFQVDEYYIPNRFYYLRKHLIHDLFIYGYDNERKTYNIVGYNSEGIFEESTIKYKEFDVALKNNNIDKEKNPWSDCVYVFKYNDKAEYKFNIKLVYKLIEDYLSSKNIFEEYNRYDEKKCNTIYGVDTYLKVIEYLQYIKLGTSFYCGENEIDYRIFRIIMEHKMLMLQRIDYICTNLKKNNELINEYSLIEKKSQKIHMLALKYGVSKKKEIIDKLIVEITEMRDEEIRILKLVLKEIEKLEG